MNWMAKVCFWLLEACWLGGLALFFDQVLALVRQDPPLPPLPSLAQALVFYPLALGIMRRVARHTPSPARRWWLGLGLMLAAMAAWLAYVLTRVGEPGAWQSPAGLGAAWSRMGWGAAWAGAGATLASWVLGWRLAWRSLDRDLFVASFQFGLGAVALVLVITAFNPVNLPGAGLLVSGVFAAGMLGLWLVRVPAGRPGGGSWLPLALVAAGLVLAAAQLAAAFCDRQFMELLMQPIYELGRLITEFLNWLARMFPAGQQPMLGPDPSKITPQAEMALQKEFNQGLAWLHTFMKIMFNASWIGLFITVIYSLMRRLLIWLRWHGKDPDRARLEASKFDLWEDIFSMFRWLGRGILALGRRLYYLLTGFNPGRHGDPWREFYARLLAWTGSRGHPRRAHQTPREYLDELSRLWPRRAPDLALITDYYLAARYGPTPPGREELAEARRLWREIKKSHKGRKARKK